MATPIAHQDIVLQAESISISYANHLAVKNVSISLGEKAVYALIGPSGCGKSSLLRSFNRMNDFVPGFALSGRISYRGVDVYASDIDPVVIRKRIGMVFQKPNPFPSSIYKNIVWGPSINGFRGDKKELVEKSLRSAALWDEVKDRLHQSGLSLSGGQQQRLCIARTIAMSPDVILMDEPCASLDPSSTRKIEELIAELKRDYAILMVTHNMQQAARVSDFTAFMYQGELIEFGPTEDVFKHPAQTLTKDYITGKFG
jgi:phosphate transport system ATP-binding protein